MAIDPGTGNIKWEHKVLTPPWGGVMATGGNLVFGGTLEGMIFALELPPPANGCGLSQRTALFSRRRSVIWPTENRWCRLQPET